MALAPHLSPDVLLRIALEKDDLRMARTALKNGANPHASWHPPQSKTQRANDPIILCAYKGNADMLSLLLEFGANPHIKTSDGMGIAQPACISGNIAFFNIIAQLGVDILSPMPSGNSPIELASGFGHAPLCAFLIKHGADPNHLRAESREPLIVHCCKRRHFKALRALLEGGADPDARSPDGSTALMVAAAFRMSDEAADTLLQFGADPLAVDSIGLDCLWHAKTADNASFLSIVEPHHRARREALSLRSSTPTPPICKPPSRI